MLVASGGKMFEKYVQNYAVLSQKCQKTDRPKKLFFLFLDKSGAYTCRNNFFNFFYFP